MAFENPNTVTHRLFACLVTLTFYVIITVMGEIDSSASVKRSLLSSLSLIVIKNNNDN